MAEIVRSRFKCEPEGLESAIKIDQTLGSRLGHLIVCSGGRWQLAAMGRLASLSRIAQEYLEKDPHSFARILTDENLRQNTSFNASIPGVWCIVNIEQEEVDLRRNPC